MKSAGNRPAGMRAFTKDPNRPRRIVIVRGVG